MQQRRIIGVIATALVASAIAHGDDKGFYLGTSLGRATQRSGVFEGEGTSFRWLAGYSFGKCFAAEAGFVDGGTQKDTIDAMDVKISSNGTFVSMLGKLPIGDHFAPYAKIGLVAYETQTLLSNGASTAREATSDEDLAYGGGLEFKLGEHFRLRADYEKVRVPDVAFDNYSLVATWKF